MSDEVERIVDMLEQGKISAGDAKKLIMAIKGIHDGPLPPLPPIPPAPYFRAGGPGRAKFLKVEVRNGDDSVDVRIPLDLIRAGMKLKSLVPSQVMENVTSQLKDKGINVDLDGLKKEDMDSVIDALSDLKVDITDGSKGTVRVFVTDQP